MLKGNSLKPFVIRSNPLSWSPESKCLSSVRYSLLVFFVSNGDGLHPTSNGLQPKSNGLHPTSDGLHASTGTSYCHVKEASIRHLIQNQNLQLAHLDLQRDINQVAVAAFFGQVDDVQVGAACQQSALRFRKQWTATKDHTRSSYSANGVCLCGNKIKL